ncbi:MAG: FeoB-associated Cys-rich membrane protein [Clostridia bacterium]|nr:FeoB-associated Cys-rich membrane protein [Clostridia bacterium]
MEWNLPTIIGTLIIAAIFFAIVFSHVRNKKKGKSGCGCGCDGCANKGFCHPENKPDNKDTKH